MNGADRMLATARVFELNFRARVIREVQEAIAGEDTVEWARKATGSYLTYPYLMELLDEMIEED